MGSVGDACDNAMAESFFAFNPDAALLLFAIAAAVIGTRLHRGEGGKSSGRCLATQTSRVGRLFKHSLSDVRPQSQAPTRRPLRTPNGSPTRSRRAAASAAVRSNPTWIRR